jgi:hypothetical protein
MNKYLVVFATDDGQWDLSGDSFQTLQEAQEHIASEIDEERVGGYNDSAFHDYHIFKLMESESSRVSIEVSRTKTVSKL